MVLHLLLDFLILLYFHNKPHPNHFDLLHTIYYNVQTKNQVLLYNAYHLIQFHFYYLLVLQNKLHTNHLYHQILIKILLYNFLLHHQIYEFLLLHKNHLLLHKNVGLNHVLVLNPSYKYYHLHHYLDLFQHKFLNIHQFHLTNQYYNFHYRKILVFQLHIPLNLLKTF